MQLYTRPRRSGPPSACADPRRSGHAPRSRRADWRHTPRRYGATAALRRREEGQGRQIAAVFVQELLDQGELQFRFRILGVVNRALDTTTGQVVALRALAKDPADRFQSAKEFVRVLDTTGLASHVVDLRTAALPTPSRVSRSIFRCASRAGSVSAATNRGARLCSMSACRISAARAPSVLRTSSRRRGIPGAVSRLPDA